jgi:hypothetical protein
MRRLAMSCWNSMARVYGCGPRASKEPRNDPLVPLRRTTGTMSAMDDHAAAPADEASAGAPVVQRVRRDRRGPVALVLVIAALALAVLEPWDRDDASPRDARSTDPSLRTPAAVVAVATDAASTPPLASPATTPPGGSGDARARAPTRPARGRPGGASW